MTEADDDGLETVRNDEVATALSLSAAVAVPITVAGSVLVGWLFASRIADS